VTGGALTDQTRLGAGGMGDEYKANDTGLDLVLKTRASKKNASKMHTPGVGRPDECVHFVTPAST
jgi:hypothetical protein